MSNLKIQAGASKNTSGDGFVEFSLLGHTVQLPKRQRFTKKEPGTDGYGRYTVKTAWAVAQADGTVKYILHEHTTRICRGATQVDLTDSLTAHLVPVTSSARSLVGGDLGIRMPLPDSADIWI